MTGPGPDSARILVAFGLSASSGALLSAASDVFGSTPSLLLATAGGLALALALPLPSLRLQATATARAWALAELALLPVLFGLMPVLASNPLRLHIDPRAWPLILAVWTSVACAPLARRARQIWSTGSPRLPADLLGWALGFAVGALGPPALAIIAATAVLALLHLPTPVAPRPPTADAHGAARALALAMATAAAISTWLLCRPVIDPTLGGAVLTLAAGGSAAIIARPLGLSRPGLATLAGAGSLLVQWVIQWKAPGLARLGLLNPAAIHPSLPVELANNFVLVIGAASAGAAIGICMGPRRTGPFVWLGLPLGAILVARGGEDLPLWLAGCVAASAPLWSLRRDVQVGGVLVAMLAAGLTWQGARPDPTEWSAGAWSVLRTPVSAAEDAALRDQLETEAVDVGVRGGFAVSRPVAPEGRRTLRSEVMAASIRLDLDGLMVEARGRLSEAESFGGSLAGALAAEQGTVLVLGDELGRATSAVAGFPFQRIVANTAPRPITQSLAELSPTLKATWLDPRMVLRPHPPSLVLAEGDRFDAIVQIIRTPWASAWQPAPGAPLFNAAGAALRPEGIYVLVLHGVWMEEGGLAAIAASLHDSFPNIQAWLPPQGADSLILVASAEGVPLQRLRERLPRSGDWTEIPGVRSVDDLASLAVSDAAGLEAWHRSQGHTMPRANGLSPATRQRPVMHLATLADHLAPPESIWSIEAGADLEPLRVRLSARESFLRLLGDATSGDMEAVFRRARALGEAGEGLGDSSLQDLIEPHLKDGRRSLQRAQSEGIASKSWDEALRYAMTAQMLAPTNAGPIVLLAEIDLGRGRVAQADEGFAKALELNPDDLGAITGAARTARLRNDLAAARTYLERATEVEPRDWRVWQNLGTLLMQTGEREAAEEALNRALQLSDGLEAAPHLALAENQLDAGKPAAALLIADQANAAQETAYGWYLRGRAHRDLGQSERAEADFRRAVLLDPQLAEARAGIGLVLAERGELEQAAEAWRAVVRLRPENGTARETLRRIEEDIAASEQTPR